MKIKKKSNVDSHFSCGALLSLIPFILIRMTNDIEELKSKKTKKKWKTNVEQIITKCTNKFMIFKTLNSYIVRII